MKIFLRVMNSSKKNQTGQMAIFIALLFQLLFVFFAMVINIGLLVHDKINLQNSVDIATIYAAQKQAEILNVIAHTNYQIHQSWKLLAWRVRVLGDYGKYNNPSFVPYPNQNVPGNLLIQNFSPQGFNLAIPTVCLDSVGWMRWRGNAGFTCQSGQNLCSDQAQTVGSLQQAVRVPGADFTGIYAAIQPIFRQAEQGYRTGCKKKGGENWNMAIRWLAAYRLDVAHRKHIIRDLAANLQQNNFREIGGGPVFDGVRKTLLANLTRSNRESIDVNRIVFKNSLAGVDRQAWLPDIPVSPVIYYTDYSCNPTAARSVLLNLDWGGRVPLYDGNVDPEAFKYDPDGTLRSFASEPPDNDNLYRSIWGVEKNPWYLAYVGLKVTTKPKQPFSPFGKGVEMVARAFAQPFGGRIGPWFKNQWQPTDVASSGTKVDSLAPERDDGTAFTPQPETQIPNFSRYPGDNLGLLSNLARSSLREFRRRVGCVHPDDYAGIPIPMEQGGDPLANNPTQAPGTTIIRSHEIAAISPNYFDALYYSIEPHWMQNYVTRFLSQFPFTTNLREDLGGRTDMPDRFSVMRQVRSFLDVMTVTPGGPSLFNWQVTDPPAQLLTSWVPQAIVDYSSAPDGFATCSMGVPAEYDNPANAIPVPGRCMSGGRVGYSVKIVSKDYLKSQELEFGGTGVKGPLKNPPPDDF